MERRSEPSAAIILSEGFADGRHTAEQLGAAVRRGELARIHRGAYFPARSWLLSPPWERLRITAVAAARALPTAVFCRETALMLHGLPILTTPQTVQIRAAHRGLIGTRPPRSAFTTMASGSLDRLCRELSAASARRVTTRDAQTLAVQRCRFPVWASDTDGRLSAEAEPKYRQGLTQLRAASSDHFDPGHHTVTVEALELAVLEYVIRADARARIVLLDAVKRRCERNLQDFEDAVIGWMNDAVSRRGRLRWESAWQFANPEAESPGESLSRLIMHTHGFLRPVLQQSFTTDSGHRFRTDFYWPEAGIVGEFDGAIKYRNARQLGGQTPAEAFTQEKERESGLYSLGLKPVRWGWEDATTPDRLVRKLDAVGVPRDSRRRHL